MYLANHLVLKGPLLKQITIKKSVQVLAFFLLMLIAIPMLKTSGKPDSIIVYDKPDLSREKEDLMNFGNNDSCLNSRLRVLVDTLSMLTQRLEEQGCAPGDLPPSVISLYYLTRFPMIVDHMPSSQRLQHIQWIAQLFYGSGDGGIYPLPPNDSISLKRIHATAMMVSALRTLNGLSYIDKNQTINFLLSYYVPTIGGFSDTIPAVADYVSPETTVFVLEALYNLDAISLVNVTATRHYLGRLQVIDKTDPEYGGIKFDEGQINQYTAWKMLESQRFIGDLLPVQDPSPNLGFNLTAFDYWFNRTNQNNGLINWSASSNPEFYSATANGLGAYVGSYRGILNNSELYLAREKLLNSLTEEGAIGSSLNPAFDPVVFVCESAWGLVGFCEPLNSTGSSFSVDVSYLDEIAPLLNWLNQTQLSTGGVMPINPFTPRLEPSLATAKIFYYLEREAYNFNINYTTLLEKMRRSYHDGAYWSFNMLPGRLSKIPWYQYSWQQFSDDLSLIPYETIKENGWPGDGVLETRLVAETASLLGISDEIWNSSQRSEIINTITASQYFGDENYSGGFVAWQSIMDLPLLYYQHNYVNLETTAASVILFSMLGVLDNVPNRTAIIDFVLRHYVENSGFRSKPVISSPTALEPTKYAIEILSTLNATGYINKTAVTQYVVAQAYRTNISIREQLAIVKTLNLLKPESLVELPLENWISTLRTKQNGEGLFYDRDDAWQKTTTLLNTANALELLSLLNATDIFEEPLYLVGNISLPDNTVYVGSSFIVNISLQDQIGTSIREANISATLGDLNYTFSSTKVNQYFSIMSIPVSTSYLGLQNITIEAVKNGWISLCTNITIQITGLLEFSEFNPNNSTTLSSDKKLELSLYITLNGKIGLPNATVEAQFLIDDQTVGVLILMASDEVGVYRGSWVPETLDG
ncbi:MAG: prenyltransferase/squalene oxidase repeat-containing protein, partial [Candidatus Ranarchaeia archaeon]